MHFEFNFKYNVFFLLLIAFRFKLRLITFGENKLKMSMHTSKELLSIINEAIQNIELDKQPERLYQPISYVLSMGGKRLRPVLCLMANEMFGGKPENAIKPALSLEVFHNFTLLHDDIMDMAVKRRNMDCVHIKWNDNVAILSGDAMQIYAYELLREVPDKHLRSCLDLFTTTAMEVCEGQQFDMDFETMDNVTEQQYMNMIRLKTAVLLACSLKMGAIIAGASEKDANLIYEFGIGIGLAFQLQDDLLDVYGESCTFGKNIGGDIVSNKKTFLLIKAMQKADESTLLQLNSWIEKKDFVAEEKIKAITDIFDKTDVKCECQKMMDYHLKKALNCIDDIQVDNALKLPLKNLATDLMKRNY